MIIQRIKSGVNIKKVILTIHLLLCVFYLFVLNNEIFMYYMAL